MANTNSKSMLNETTGGGVTENNAEKSSAISEIVISGTNACSVAKTMSHIFSTSSSSSSTMSKQQQQHFASLSAENSSSSSLISTTSQQQQQQHQQLRKVHTLSFLHNEDLLSSKTFSKDFHDFAMESSEKVTKMMQKQGLTLSRSISFNDPRRQQQFQQRSSVQRTESTKEYDIKRKMTILSPIHSNFHGCFDSSSELSSM